MLLQKGIKNPHTVNRAIRRHQRDVRALIEKYVMERICALGKDTVDPDDLDFAVSKAWEELQIAGPRPEEYAPLNPDFARQALAEYDAGQWTGIEEFIDELQSQTS